MSNIFDRITKALDEHGVLDKQTKCPKCGSQVSIIMDGEEYAYGKHLTPNNRLCIMSNKQLEAEDPDVIDVEGEEK